MHQTSNSTETHGAKIQFERHVFLQGEEPVTLAILAENFARHAANMTSQLIAVVRTGRLSNVNFRKSCIYYLVLDIS